MNHTTETEHTKFRFSIFWRFLAIQFFLMAVYICCALFLKTRQEWIHLAYTFLYSMKVVSGYTLVISWLFAGLYAIWNRWGSITFYKTCEGISVTLFILYILYIYRQPLMGGLPSSGDHITHFTLATFTEYNLRFFQQITGWCSAISLGIPLNELYPPGGNLLVCFVRAISLGMIPREQAYTAVVLFAYFSFASLMYAIVRRHFGRLAAILFLGLMACDVGRTFFGLYHSFEGGMWASQLSVGLSLFAFAQCAEPRFPRSARQAAGIACAIGASMLLHPFSFFVNVLWILLLGIYHLFFQRAQFDRPQNLVWNPVKLLCVALGFGLAAFYLFPFLLSREWIASYASWGMVGLSPGRSFLEGDLFVKSPYFYTLLGLPAIGIALFSRRPFLFTLSLFCFINLFLTLDGVRTFSSLQFVRDFFAHMQVLRLLTLAKLGSYILAAGYMGWLIRHAWVEANGQQWFSRMGRIVFSAEPAGRWGKCGYIAILCCGLILLMAVSLPYVYIGSNTAQAFWMWDLSFVSDIIYTAPKAPAFWKDIQALIEPFAYASQGKSPAYFLREPMPRERIMTMSPWRPIAIPLFAPLGVYNPGYIPAILLRTRPASRENWHLKMANVRYMMDFIHEDDAAFQSNEGFSEFREHESLKLCTNDAWNGQNWILHGTGAVERVPTKDGSIEFSLQDTSNGAILRLGISRYRKWHAYLNGKPVTTHHPNLPGEPFDAYFLMGIPIEDGTLKIVYEDAWYDTAAGIVTLISILLILLLCFPPAWRQFAGMRIPWVRPSWVFVLDCLLVSGVLIVLLLSYFTVHTKKVASFYYLGVFADHVGKHSYKPDHELDICYDIQFHRQQSHGRIQEIVIQAYSVGKDPQPLNHIWSTKNAGCWKIAVVDSLGNRCEREDGTLHLPDTPWHRLLLFISNAYPNGIPSHVKLGAKVIYEDGTEQLIRD
ncbi:hypothetical protein GF373_14390 [bacterium]|nr:hypothetical protein [bacterium]